MNKDVYTHVSDAQSCCYDAAKLLLMLLTRCLQMQLLIHAHGQILACFDLFEYIMSLEQTELALLSELVVCSGLCAQVSHIRMFTLNEDIQQRFSSNKTLIRA